MQEVEIAIKGPDRAVESVDAILSGLRRRRSVGDRDGSTWRVSGLEYEDHERAVAALESDLDEIDPAWRDYLIVVR